MESIASQPVAMNTESAEAGDWYVTIELPDPSNSQLRMALSIADVMYYAETTAVFIDYETAFSRDNFSQ